MGKLLEKIDEAANNWNKTKDSKYKDLWYKLIKEYRYGKNFKRIVKWGKKKIGDSEKE